MATYVVGDIQGCDDAFARLLDACRFDPSSDRLWLLGDLVNRGPDSLAVLRRVQALGAAADVVLGNHDLHFLAVHYGGHTPNRSDTFDTLLAAPDCDRLAHWLRSRKLLLVSEQHRVVATHAGVPHIWSVTQAAALAAEVERILPRAEGGTLLKKLYGNEPPRWEERFSGLDRWRLIINYLTRMRLIAEDGTLNFSHKGGVQSLPAGFVPWYGLHNARVDRDSGYRFAFGHWAALEGETGSDVYLALDTGCVWGRRLTAWCMETGRTTAVDAENA